MHSSISSFTPSRHSFSAVAHGTTPPAARAVTCKAHPATFTTSTKPSLADDFILPLDRTEKLPAGYEDLTRRLVTALQDAVSADVNGASENEVRRKADPAKGLVKEWVQKWRDNRLVRGADSHDQLSAMLQELGTYYQKNGARSRMNKDVGGSLLDKLKAAEASLPPVEAKKKGLFG